LKEEHTDLDSESKIRVLSFSEGTETEITGEDENQTGTDSSGERSGASFLYETE
jgi:hypothetical protein